MRHEADDRAVEEPEEQPEHHLAPAEPAEDRPSTNDSFTSPKPMLRGDTMCSTTKTDERDRAGEQRRGRTRPSSSSASAPSAEQHERRDRERVHDPVRQQERARGR